MSNFNAEELKKTVLLYSAAGMSVSEVTAATNGDVYKAILEKIAVYFNREDNVWHENLKMVVYNYPNSGYYSLHILDRHTGQGLFYGRGSYYNSNIGIKHDLRMDIFQYSNDVWIELKYLYFTYIKCKNGYVCGFSNELNDDMQLIRLCGFKGKNASGEEYVTIAQNNLHYYIGTENYGCMVVEGASFVGCTGSRTILTPFYVPCTDLLVPDVYRCEGNVLKTGRFYELNGSVYVNCMHHGQEYNYDVCKLAFKVG